VEGTINAVVEIPAGTNEKWEVKRYEENPEGYLKRDFEDGKPRTVKYLPYPFNYGMVPGTRLSEKTGGDRDPLDVIILGSSVPRGTIKKTKIIGVLKLIDRGEVDHKLITIPGDSPLVNVESLEQLDKEFPGVTQIIETFFIHYKGPGKMKSNGYGDVAEAKKIFQEGLEGFRSFLEEKKSAH